MRAPENLLADCGSCFGLCCVALPFAKSSDFAVDKAAGEPCRNLRQDSRCGIHSTLRERGFPGCTVYDCFGAGQKVSQSTFAGRDWRQQPSNSSEMFAVFPIMRDVHELLWYLADARDRDSAATLHDPLSGEYAELEALTESVPEVLLSVDVSGLRSRINELLLEASDLVRAEVRGKKKNYRGRDMIGAQLAGADLRGASLRGTYFIGATLRGADLRLADLIGADLRGADLRGADLRGSIYTTQFQINAAQGDLATRIPESLTRPSHWA
ncbi:pentapeptide repeat-containing protein [Rhodococcus sp. SBT000017]|uniref:pentapeptide repeat-containing protein n=2 Tax=unclassified Rhodococcus (in: high G+C Gram-positive bacteria) TaxID=192944 RepID=UPI000EF8EF4F|nr:pentapeptide repeat-containing protein [Rhodococcus sp. SBT000017]RMB77626.1 pentapeptide repeat-containing protein [Rhodococcus sp. SBT000017]